MRKPSNLVLQRNIPILDRIYQLKAEHPFWGYRRIWAHLNFIDHILVNKKRVFRLMKEHHLLVKENGHLRAKRTSDKPKPRAERPDQIYGIDMTKIKLIEEGWAYLVLVIDWYTKKIVGWEIDYRSKSSHWLKALNQAACLQCPEGTRGKGLRLVSDNGCQPTSVSFMQAVSAMGIEQIFTSYSNPQGNADTERVFRTLKEEIIWTREYGCLNELKVAIQRWVEYYNTEYLHSSLGYKPPVYIEEEYKRKAA
jgi:transposase InsO family protein